MGKIIHNGIVLGSSSLLQPLDTALSDTSSYPVENKTIKAYIDSIKDSIYPIGSIYISAVNSSPAILYGGAWEIFGTGETLVGVDASQDEFSTVLKEGGSKYMQDHKHRVIVQNSNGFTGPDGQVSGCGCGGSNHDGGQTTTDVYTSSDVQLRTGNSGNLQPYITVYFWKRIS